MMASYLVFSSLSVAQSRSAQRWQQVSGNGVGATEYWWPWIAGPNGQAALVIADSGDYGATGLTATEQGQLQTAAQLTALGWTIP